MIWNHDPSRNLGSEISQMLNYWKSWMFVFQYLELLKEPRSLTQSNGRDPLDPTIEIKTHHKGAQTLMGSFKPAPITIGPLPRDLPP
jgi:hypothetical protein